MNLGKHRVTRILLGLAIVLCFVGITFAVRHYYYILVSGQPSSNPAFVSYRLDDARRLLVGSDATLLINIRERVVLSLSPSDGQRLGPVVLWRRDATRGVVLGDPVKGSEEDSYLFNDRGVNIRYTSAAARHDLHVPL
jgi:hypothetical protein